MLITLDTNVMYQALHSSAGASHALLRLVRSGAVRLALSHPVLLEYEAVLTRQNALHDFGLAESDVMGVLRYLAYTAEKFEPRFLFRPNLRDEDDNMLVELAVASQSQYLVTRNLKDYRSAELRFTSFETISPSEFMRRGRIDHVQG